MNQRSLAEGKSKDKSCLGFKVFVFVFVKIGCKYSAGVSHNVGQEMIFFSQEKTNRLNVKC
jgi:hypothetical protein